METDDQGGRMKMCDQPLISTLWFSSPNNSPAP
jgi:hypothetical protein